MFCLPWLLWLPPNHWPSMTLKSFLHTFIHMLLVLSILQGTTIQATTDTMLLIHRLSHRFLIMPPTLHMSCNFLRKKKLWIKFIAISFEKKSTSFILFPMPIAVAVCGVDKKKRSDIIWTVLFIDVLKWSKNVTWNNIYYVQVGWMTPPFIKIIFFYQWI